MVGVRPTPLGGSDDVYTVAVPGPFQHNVQFARRSSLDRLCRLKQTARHAEVKQPNRNLSYKASACEQDCLLPFSHVACKGRAER